MPVIIAKYLHENSYDNICVEHIDDENFNRLNIDSPIVCSRYFYFTWIDV